MSPRINVLDETVANKIAAGEVVERPASVVKELVENSIDAGARSILVEVRGGGRESIRVLDDGCGMDEDDALLAFERHATSKIKEFEDLERIGTLGFRGEALPSIASVSRLTLTTATAESEAGTRIEIHGGKLIRVERVPHAPGTEILVRRLFYNTPARRAFLRSANTELGHIVGTVTDAALAHPELGFRLIHAERVVLDCPPSRGFVPRLAQVLGAERAQSLIPVFFRQRGLRMFGAVSAPGVQFSHRRYQRVFINGRPVRDKVIASAIQLAYRGKIPDRRHPMVYLHIQLDPREVDVNVHPSKLEVRFSDANRVHEGVLRGISQVLERALYDRYKRRLEGSLPLPDGAQGEPAPEQPAGDAAGEHRHRVLEALSRAAAGGGQAPAAPSGLFHQLEPRPHPAPGQGSGVPESAAAEVEIPTPAAATTAGAEAPASAAGSAAEAAAAPTEETAPADERALLGTRGPRVIGQLGGTFILLEDRGDLLLVDQHTAHERVLFERLRAARQQGNVPVQQLLVPLVLQLTPAEEQLLREHQEELETLGFRIEEFGNRSFAVHSCPAILRKLDLQQLVPELLADLSELGGSSRTQGLIDEVTMSIACKAAVKAHAPLDPVQLQALIDQLFQTGTPGTCPHGRPIVLRINRRDIEKFFQR